MTDGTAETQGRKRELRRRYLGVRTSLDTEERARASEQIADNLFRSHFFQRSHKIACYLSIADEVDTWRIIARAWRMQKRIFAPVTQRNRMLEFREMTPDSDLERDDYGLLMPRSGPVIAARKLDLVLTPLVAFDEQRQRIGMGGGYYDRTFSFLRGRRVMLKPQLVGLAYACQQTPEIPANPWDIRLYRVITERG